MVITFQSAMTKKGQFFSRKNMATPSVAAPGDTNPSDATVSCVFMDTLLHYRHQKVLDINVHSLENCVKSGVLTALFVCSETGCLEVSRSAEHERVQLTKHRWMLLDSNSWKYCTK